MRHQLHVVHNQNLCVVFHKGVTQVRDANVFDDSQTVVNFRAEQRDRLLAVLCVAANVTQFNRRGAALTLTQLAALWIISRCVISPKPQTAWTSLLVRNVPSTSCKASAVLPHPFGWPLITVMPCQILPRDYPKSHTLFLVPLLVHRPALLR